MTAFQVREQRVAYSFWPTPADPMGFRRSTRDVEHRAQHRITPLKREAVIAGLASEGLALILGSAEGGRSAVVGPTPTDPVEFRKRARDLKALSAVTRVHQ